MEEHGINILHVEDSPADARLVAEMLKDSGGRVGKTAWTSTLGAALKALGSELFDVVLLDLNLPDSRGLEGFEKIEAAFPGAAVILLTGHEDRAVVDEALLLHSVDYLLKSDLNPHLLLRVIMRAAGQKRAERRLTRLNRALKAHGASARAMLQARSETEYLTDICSIVAASCGSPLVWISFGENAPGRTVRVAAFAGSVTPEFRRSVNTWADTGSACGPTETAIRTGLPSVCHDVCRDAPGAGYRERMLSSDYRSALGLPLKEKDLTLGALTLYSREPNVFSGEEIALLAELAADVSSGLVMLRARLGRDRAERELVAARDEMERRAEERAVALTRTRGELAQARRLSDIGLLAATVAHELRNPLAAITMATYNIARKAGGPLIDGHLRNIEKKIGESNHIISNLLFYSRLKPPQYERADLSAILKDCLTSARGMGSRRNKPKICVDIPWSLPLEGDPVQLREIFSNILSNALDAVAKVPGGQVVLRAAARDGAAVLEVADNGEGMTNEVLERVYEPFFTTKAKGTGLGLPVCKQMVELHGGSIEIASVPGRGTAVKVQLPRKRAHEK